MRMNYDVQQMINLAISYYDLPSTSKATRAYREKIVRALKDEGRWNTEKRGQTFDESTVRNILYRGPLKEYFEKRAGEKYLIKKKMEADYYDQLASEDLRYDSDGEFHEEAIPYQYYERRRDFMLEALFSKFFEFDENAYKRDMLLLQEFDPETVPTEYAKDYKKAHEISRCFETRFRAYVKDRTDNGQL